MNMKRKLLSLLMIAFIVPTMFLFSACGDKSYKLANLKTDFFSVANSCEAIVVKDNELQFDYSSFLHNNEEFMVELIDTTKPYTYLKEYNQTFKNLMSFVYSYVEVCSNDSIEVDGEYRDALKAEMDKVHHAITMVDTNTHSLTEIIKANSDEPTNLNCMARYKILLKSYESLFQASIPFVNMVADLYFDYALQNANQNYSNLSVSEFDAGLVVNKIKARVNWQITNLTQAYVEIHFDGGNIADLVANMATDFDSLVVLESSYTDKIANIEIGDFDINAATSRANGSSYKNSFYNLAIECYNIQAVLNNNFDIFVRACNNVSYHQVVSKENKTAKEELNIKQINEHQAILDEYTLVLMDMLNIMGV